ncbi:MAG: hypothetical protein KAT05_10180 [Spirochaetes bacterium]|nr:hypothetical protein [Spirochaetota bacterium]
MRSIDDIKKKLNIEELDKNTRDKMFNKFVEKGGKVIKEKKQSPIISFNRDRQKLLKEKMRRKKEGLKRLETEKKSAFYKNSYGITKKNKKNKRYLIIYITGLFQRIFSFSHNFTKKFLLDMQEDIIKILSELNNITEQLLNIESEKKWPIVDSINKSNSYGFEIVIRINNLYEKRNFLHIANYFKLHHQIICPEIINNLLVFFKKLLILYPYWETTKNTIWKSQQLYRNATSIAPILSKSKINKNIDKLFSYYLPRILTILNYNLGKKTPYEYTKMYLFVKITSNEDIGNITKDLVEEKKDYLKQIEKEKEERMKKLQEEVEKKEIEKIPKYIQKGLAIIDSIVEKIPQKINDDRNAELFEPNEKLLEFYFLFKEFDLEYSFIMTTSQIKFTTKLEYGTRIDIKSDFDNLYIKFNEIDSFLKQYIKLLEQLFNIDENKKDSSKILQQKISNLEIKRIQNFNEIKIRASAFFKQFAFTLQKIINDYNKEKTLLQNGNEILHFQLELNDKRKFENISILNAILITFSFSSALHYYLTNDKLSGRGLYIHDKKK